VYRGRIDKAMAILARAAKFNNTKLPQGRLVTLEEKECHLRSLKEQQKKSTLDEAAPEVCVTMNTMLEDHSSVSESNSDVAMVAGVRYRKESPGNGDIVDEAMDPETVEMVSIVAESDKTELITSSPSNVDKGTSQHVCPSV